MTRKRTIKECQDIAKEHGGKCLSLEYIDGKTKLEWECGEHHIWHTAPNNIFNSGCWCPECVANRQKLTIEMCQEHAKGKGGKCLSAEYKNALSKLEWECKEGHIWSVTPNQVLNNDTWCAQCVKVAKLSIEICQEYAESKKGKCLSIEYINSKTKLEWECEEKHTWFATPSNIFFSTWCPQCCSNFKKTIEECKDYAESKGGECLSVEYINSKTKLLWKCGCGYIWEATPGHVLTGTWCPLCAKPGDKIRGRVLSILKSIFMPPECKIEINKKGFKWLIGPNNGEMELDFYIYNKAFTLGIEYDGEQHFKPVQFGGISMKRARENFKAQKKRDRKKNKLLREHKDNIMYFVRFNCKEKITKEFVADKLIKFGVPREFMNV